jgi:hypothetical protein
MPYTSLLVPINSLAVEKTDFKLSVGRQLNEHDIRKLILSCISFVNLCVKTGNYAKYVIKSCLILSLNVEACCTNIIQFLWDRMSFIVQPAALTFTCVCILIFLVLPWRYLHFRNFSLSFYISGLIASGRSYRDKQILVSLKQKILLLLPVTRIPMC